MRNAFKFLMGALMVAMIVSCTVVGASDRAVKVNLGQIQGGVVQPGMYWFMPFVEGYPTFSLLPKEVDYDMAVGKDGGITRDNQTIGASMKGFYRYKADQIVAVYRDFSEDRVSSLFATAMRQSVKAVIGQYTIFEIASKQDVIRTQTIEELRASIQDLPIEVTDIRITNYDWTDEFDKQIAAKLQADAKVAEGEGIRRYNQSIAQNLDVQLKLKALDIEATRVEKWDGRYVANNNYGPIPVQTGNIQGK